MPFVDTTVLIDLQRGTRSRRRMEAENGLKNHPAEKLGIPTVVPCEFSEGLENPDLLLLAIYRQGYRIIPAGAGMATYRGRLAGDLRAAGESIGGNDTWIAVTALLGNCRLLTRNAGHSSRVPHLMIVTNTHG